MYDPQTHLENVSMIQFLRAVIQTEFTVLFCLFKNEFDGKKILDYICDFTNYSSQIYDFNTDI